ncbi:MAG: chorismate synthase [Candidatus Aminicenantes bacterium]
MLRFLSAGESHGKALMGIVEGMVAGVKIGQREINAELRLRKKVWGRGPRSSTEDDGCEILSGVIEGKTTGSPVALKIDNKEKKFEQKTVPRPGHADLAGAIKYNFKNIHLVAERASARETAVRVAVGKIAKKFLAEFGVDFLSHTVMIGGIRASINLNDIDQKTKKMRNESDLYCLDKEATSRMKEKIKEAEQKGDTAGGISEVLIKGLPPGIGSHVHYDRRLDYRLAGSLMSIPSVKAVEIGEGFLAPQRFGSEFHDALAYENQIRRQSNNAGGIEGGISNGELIVVRLYVKPVPTLRKPLSSFDLITGKSTQAPYVRSDVCVVPSAGIIGEAAAGWEIARSFLEKFGGDTLSETKKNFDSYSKNIMNLKNGGS